MNYSSSSDDSDSYESDNSSDEESYTFSVYLIDSKAKSDRQPYDEVTFEPHEDFTYDNLIDKLNNCFPVLKDEEFYLTCIGEKGNSISIEDDNDLEEATNEFDDDECNLYVVYNDEIENSKGDSLPSQFFCNECCFALKRYRWKCSTCPDYDLCDRCKENGIHDVHSFSYFDITPLEDSSDMEIEEISYYDLYSRSKLGEGCFGEVYSAYCSSLNNEKVAVKLLKDPYDDDHFLREIEVLEKMGEHENVVQILGYIIDDRHMGIVMEHVTVTVNSRQTISGLDSYFMYLRGLLKRGRDVDVRELDSFALQIARGMQHLEFNGILHRDLAARNILIDGQKNVKISDFGVSRLGDYYDGNDIFAIRWCSPEVLRENHYSHASDVWAYGIVLWEIATLGALPYGDKTTAQVSNFVRRNGHLYKPSNVSDRLFKIMERCWTVRPENRPNFSALVEKMLDFRWIGPAYFSFDSLDDDFGLPDPVEVYESRYNGY